MKKEKNLIFDQNRIIVLDDIHRQIYSNIFFNSKLNAGLSDLKRNDKLKLEITSQITLIFNLIIRLINILKHCIYFVKNITSVEIWTRICFILCTDVNLALNFIKNKNYIITAAGRLYFVCTCLYRSLFRLYLKQLNKKWKIKNYQRGTLRFFLISFMPFERKSFVPFLLSFVSQRVRRYSTFQFLRERYIANLANF